MKRILTAVGSALLAALLLLPSDCTGQSVEKVAVDTERDNFMPAEEAVKYGLIDEVIYHR